MNRSQEPSDRVIFVALRACEARLVWVPPRGYSEIGHYAISSATPLDRELYLAAEEGAARGEEFYWRELRAEPLPPTDLNALIDF